MSAFSSICRIGVGLLLSVFVAMVAAGEPDSIAFRKHVIDATFPAISAVAVDVDGDGLLDVIAAGGPSGGHSEWSNLVNWYKAPDWERHRVCALEEGATREELVIILHMENVNFTTRNPPSHPLQFPPEIVIADARQGHIWWYRYDRGQAEWTGSIIADRVQGAHGIASGDISGNGYHDLVIPTTRGTPARGMIWIENPGPGAEQTGLWKRHLIASEADIPSSQHYVRLVDINGNGKLDVLHGSSGRQDGWFGFWLQGDAPDGEWTERKIEGPMRRATNLDAADLTGDGRQELVGSEGHGTGLWLFVAPDYQPVRIDETLISTHSLALGDLTGNGRVDIVTCGYDSKTVAVFLNRGNLTFERIDIDTDQAAYDLTLVDLNGNGRLDILLAGQRSGNLVWYENLGADAKR